MHKPDQDPFPELLTLSEDERRLRILEGLADADAGRLIPMKKLFVLSQISRFAA